MTILVICLFISYHVFLVSNAVKDGNLLVNKVLQKLKESGFSINTKKCFFLNTVVEYLGLQFSGGQVSPSGRKIEPLSNSSAPANVKQVPHFLGLAGYFRRQIAVTQQKRHLLL